MCGFPPAGEHNITKMAMMIECQLLDCWSSDELCISLYSREPVEPTYWTGRDGPEKASRTSETIFTSSGKMYFLADALVASGFDKDEFEHDYVTMYGIAGAIASLGWKIRILCQIDGSGNATPVKVLGDLDLLRQTAASWLRILDKTSW